MPGTFALEWRSGGKSWIPDAGERRKVCGRLTYLSSSQGVA